MPTNILRIVAFLYRLLAMLLRLLGRLRSLKDLWPDDWEDGGTAPAPA